MVAYTVRISCPDVAVASAMRAWLVGGHAAEVCAAGALRAEVTVDADGGGRRIECRYLFATREAFAAYERDHAPRLRAEGLQRFPPSTGVVYDRATGDVVGIWPPPGGA